MPLGPGRRRQTRQTQPTIACRREGGWATSGMYARQGPRDRVRTSHSDMDARARPQGSTAGQGASSLPRLGADEAPCAPMHRRGMLAHKHTAASPHTGYPSSRDLAMLQLQRCQYRRKIQRLTCPCPRRNPGRARREGGRWSGDTGVLFVRSLVATQGRGTRRSS